MSVRTLAVLALLVAGLGVLAWWQAGREADPGFQPGGRAERLLPGVDPARVERVRLEHLERDVVLVLERGAEGGWTIVDPVRYPANESLVRLLLDQVRDNRLDPLDAAERDPAALGLEPPRAVLRVFEAAAGGAEARTATVELGALDLDGARVAARVGERLGRTSRNLDTTLDRDLDGWRSRRALDLSPEAVVELHRSGSSPALERGAARDLELDALADAGEWRVTAPVQARGDPVALELVVRAAALLEATAFLDDGKRPLAEFGLAEPELSITLVALGGERRTLHFGRTSIEGRWCATSAGSPYVWSVDGNSVRLVATPAEVCLDPIVVRVLRSEVDEVRLAEGPRELRLRRTGGGWTVARLRPDGAWAAPVRAEAALVEDLLGRIEAAEIAGFDLDARLADEDVAARFVLVADGREHGAVLGQEVVVAGGARARLLRRLGDDALGHVDPELIEVCRVRLEDLQSRLLTRTSELDLASLTLTAVGPDAAARERTWVRGNDGLWRPEGLDLEARELHPVLDGLLFLRAEHFLGEGPHPPLEDALRVDFEAAAGVPPVPFVLGFAPRPDGPQEHGGRAGRWEVEIGSARAALSDAQLGPRLRALLEGDG